MAVQTLPYNLGLQPLPSYAARPWCFGYGDTAAAHNSAAYLLPLPSGDTTLILLGEYQGFNLAIKNQKEKFKL